MKSVKILGKRYNIEETFLNLHNKKIRVLPDLVWKLTKLKSLNLMRNQLVNLSDSIGTLVDLEYLYLSYNKLISLPESINNLNNLKYLEIMNNQLTSIPTLTSEIKYKIHIGNTSYEINNLNFDCEFLIFRYLTVPLDNLPFNLKELWLHHLIKNPQIKLPFGCVIRHY
jgi:Leucine-rich repeat (LRR) protein